MPSKSEFHALGAPLVSPVPLIFGGPEEHDWKQRALIAEAQLRVEGERNRQLTDRLEWMRDIGEALASRRDTSDAIGMLLDRAVRVVGGALGALYLVEEDGAYITARTMVGDRIKEIRLAVGEGLAGTCASTRRVINVKDARRDPRWRYAFDDITGAKTRAVLCVPLVDVQGALLGVIQVLNKNDETYFSVDDEELLISVANNVSMIIENFRYYFEQVSQNIELNEMRHVLEDRVRELDVLSALQQRIAEATTKDDELAAAHEAALALIDADGCVISYAQDGEMVSLASFANQPGRFIPYERNSELFHRVLNSAQPVMLDGDALLDADFDPVLREEFNTYLGVAIRVNGVTHGAIEVGRHPRPTSSPFTEEHGKLLLLIAGQVGRFIDNSRGRRRREREGRVAALGAMLSGVLHDLKTPLTISSGYVQLMERADDPERRRLYGDAVRRQFDDVRNMTQEIIAYARGEVSLYERTVHLTVFAEELEEWLRHEFEDSVVRVCVNLETRGDIRIDEGKLKRILFNLARNAHEAMRREGGTYTVTISRAGERLVVRSTDTGPGIPSEVRKRLFEPFVSSGKTQRSGLGLSIVKRLAEELNGTVRFDTELGVGTTFTISCPWKAIADETAIAVPAALT